MGSLPLVEERERRHTGEKLGVFSDIPACG